MLDSASDTHRELLGERPIDAPKPWLHAIVHRLPHGGVRTMPMPLTPLPDTALLTNAPDEPVLSKQLESEIASADRIDAIVAFIRFSGIRPLFGALRRYRADGRPLRVLTTTYTGSTEQRALDELDRLGAEIRVSYDLGHTRLHAKAWLFHRASGPSTAFVGSSNLTAQAQSSGLEWNVRASTWPCPTAPAAAPAGTRPAAGRWRCRHCGASACSRPRAMSCPAGSTGN